MTLNVGRNDPCPCGSGKKYKKCHLGKKLEAPQPQKRYRHFSGVVFDDSATNLSLYKKNMTLVEGAIDIFRFKEGADLRDIKRNVSRDQISELFKLVAWLWPPDTNVYNFLPAPSDNLRALYLGNMRPETILRSVGRYSLYCDEILVMNPFINPWCIVPEYNPLIHPEEYVGDTWKWVLFILQLAPWIYDKQVILLPQPTDFDSELRKKTWEMAQKRMGDSPTKEFKKIVENDLQLKELSLEDFKRSWMSMPEYALRKKIKEFKPSMTAQDVDGMIEYINKLKDEDPYFITNPKEKGAFGMKTMQSGGNLEQGLYLSQLTGSYLYTDMSFRWKEILSAQHEDKKNNIWSPISYGFQKLDFKFLDGVDLQFVLNIKADGRLSNLRNFLRKTWRGINDDGISSYEHAHKLALEFSDELKEEHSKADIEWNNIDADLRKWLLGRSGLGAILATGGMDWVLPALGFSLEGVGRLLSSRYDRKKFRKNVPLSVFIDLKNK